jgi:hypothetical protein
MTEEEFKELTGSLETVGHYTPTVRDMFQFLVDRKGHFRVDPESPKVWRGYAGVKLNKGQDVGGLDLGYFPEAGRFEAAINELLTANTGSEDMTIYPKMAREFGLDLQLTSTPFSAQFVITLPAEELIAEHEKHKALINKL